MFHMKQTSGCESDCVEIRRLEGTSLVIYPALNAGEQVSRSSLTAFDPVGAPAVPLARQSVELGNSIGIKTCRLTVYPRGLKHGLRPGMRVSVALPGAMRGELTLLAIQDEMSVGVYDVQKLTPD
jgi:hypothetical protein